jgi:hypothetical protein
VGDVEVKMVASVRSLSSRWVAWALSAAYLVVSVAVGVALLVMPKIDTGQRGNPATYISDNTSKDPDTLTSQAPPGFQHVNGPVGLRTVIPDGWQTVTAGGPGALRAVDPADPGRIIGYGGARASSPDLVGVHIAYEKRYSDLTKNYRRVELNKAAYAGHPAVEWEFLHDDGRGIQRVQALYWLVEDTEYFVFVSGPDTQWPRMRVVYDAMVANSRP